ncbi:CsgG/HfaB family protein [Flavobacterium sp. MXW15]|uniref:CsgG/HfaB family protein n=1 Tax=Xanthomonas chitinilytica TaxID=2989819 RepID=A0ABT3JT36_9XANT|nr:CsgG/HfaB family protein [Xanthomonas sp. H13-6]MCW4454419.1 CsgG/HfaB family protein [Flavobacterium sp. MXW15]MCW4471659.1 CsgG/HfaB family protein [Xanthomonas sp. H13-6]
MTMSTRLLSLLVSTSLLVACGQKPEPQEAAAPAATLEQPVQEEAAPLRGAPDFGGTIRVSREAEGIGSTPELAVLAALQSAVAQVNGVRVAGSLQSVRAGLDVAVDGHAAASLGAEAFRQQVVTASQGAVLGYEILSQEEVDKVDSETVSRVRASDGGFSYSASASASGRASAKAQAGDASASASTRYSEKGQLDIKRGASSFESDLAYTRMRSYWKVRIKADIAQYRVADEEGRPKIVVAAPRVLSASYAVGDNRVAADEVARAIRTRLSDTLTQTRRFIVLDREFGDELQAEIDHIGSGNVRLADTARLGQQLATDLILIPTIERFEYPRSTRQLRMSDRQVSSYSGGGRITLRLLNATTGEVVMSDSFDHQLASSGPSTLPRTVDGKGMAAAMMDALSGQIGSAVVTGIFPVSVVALDGDQVILSQGGDLLEAGQRYQAVRLGEELKDPQTGRSLGRNETPCCTIRIDRVATQTSYGTVVEGTPPASGFVPGSIELRQKLKPARSEASAAPAAAAKPATRAASRPAAAPAPAPVDDPNW